MDDKSLNKSGCPSGQMIVQKSNSDCNLGPITELELTLKLPPKCTKSKQDNISGAGANAGLEGMVLANTDPLSELVWSPHKGLSLKCADCNPAEKKTLLWGTVLSAPESVTIKKEYDVEPLAGEKLQSSEIVPHLGGWFSDRVMLMGSPSSTKNVTCLEQKLGFDIDVKVSTTKEEPLSSNLNDEDDCLDKKGKKIYVPTNFEPTETSRINRKQDLSNPEKDSSREDDIYSDSSSKIYKEKTNYSVCISPESQNSESSHLSERNINFDCGKATCSNPEKFSVQGLDNPTDSSSTKLKLYCERMSPETRGFKKAANSDPSEGNSNLNGGSSHSAYRDCKPSDASTSKKCGRHNTPIHHSRFFSNHEELDSFIQEGMRKTTASSSKLLLGKRDSTSENVIKSLKSENEVDLFEASPDTTKTPLCRRKEKGKVLCKDEDSAKDPNDDDSHESVESCNNSKSLVLARKRPWDFDEHLAMENKKMKGQPDESPHRTSTQRHGSSFMSWISNMVKGSSKTNLQETTSTDIVIRPPNVNRSDGQHTMLQERDKEFGYTSTGFGTVFKALYRSGVHASDTGKPNADYDLGEGSKQLAFSSDKCDESHIPFSHCKEIIKFGDEAVVSTENMVMCGDGGITLSPTAPQNNSFVHEEQKTFTVDNNNLLKIQCGHGQGGKIAPNSLLQNSLDSPSEVEEMHNIALSAPNKSLSFVTKSAHTVGSLWITRFYPNVSSPVIDSYHCEQNVGASVKGPSDCISILSQNRKLSVNGQSSCENQQEPSREDHLDVVNDRPQDSVIKSDGSFGSMEGKEHIDMKLKSETNSEAMACVFARRLDALRHIPTKVDENTSHAFDIGANTSHASPTCIFCGIKGHKLQECLKITESELDSLLKNIDSYKEVEESSCLCIRCFQLNHWAIACPNISSRKRFHPDGSSLLDFKFFGKRLQTQRKAKITEDRNPLEETVCGGVVAVAVTDSAKQKVGNEFRAGGYVNKKGNNVAIIDRNYPDSRMIRKDLIGDDFCGKNSMKKASSEFLGNGKKIKTSSSKENMSKEYQITAFYNFVNRQIPVIPRGTFEAIRKLRLSRTDIFKWRRSPVALFPLEGFFIRPRLRKWEKELGRTGYCVARINGGLRERSPGSSKVILSVMIGGSKCIVENRFVSNHDFLEDELVAWWCATLKAGGNLPSEKDLEMKLRERISLGF